MVIQPRALGNFLKMIVVTESLFVVMCVEPTPHVIYRSAVPKVIRIRIYLFELMRIYSSYKGLRFLKSFRHPENRSIHFRI